MTLGEGSNESRVLVRDKYITIAIETQENDLEIGIMRAENDIEDEEIEVHMAELSPRGFPIT